MQASRKSDVQKVAMLIENGAKVDLQDVDGNTALHHAVLNLSIIIMIHISMSTHLTFAVHF